MKKICIVSVTLLLAVFLAACGAQAPAAVDDSAIEQDTAAEETAAEEITGPFNENDMIFAHDGVEYPISTPAQPLLDMFGSDYELVVAPSCVYGEDGDDKQFIYDFATVNTYPMDGEDIIDEIYIYGGDYVTSRGIALGDTLEMVIEAYGEGGFEDGESYVYALSGDQKDMASQRLYFEMTDGVVTGISYYGANNVVL